jgi:hypothetical protein
MDGQGDNKQSTVAEPGATCLFLGPRGERCSRPAKTAGFCARHGEEPDANDSVFFLRRGAAVILLLLFLWVVFARFLRELADLLR